MQCQAEDGFLFVVFLRISFLGTGAGKGNEKPLITKEEVMVARTSGLENLKRDWMFYEARDGKKSFLKAAADYFKGLPETLEKTDHVIQNLVAFGPIAEALNQMHEEGVNLFDLEEGENPKTNDVTMISDRVNKYQNMEGDIFENGEVILRKLPKKSSIQKLVEKLEKAAPKVTKTATAEEAY